MMTRKSKIVAVGDTATTILSMTTGTKATVVSLLVGNVDGANAATVSLALTKSGDTAKNIVTAVPVAAGDMIQVFNGGNDSLFLESGDILTATASANGDVNVTCSYIYES